MEVKKDRFGRNGSYFELMAVLMSNDFAMFVMTPEGGKNPSFYNKSQQAATTYIDAFKATPY